MALYRDHRGSLEESLKTVIEVSSIEDIRKHIFENIDYVDSNGVIEFKHFDHDYRINWDSYLVVVDNIPIGYTNGDLK